VLGLSLLVGCSDDQNLAPVIARIQANVECGVAPCDVQFLAIASGGDLLQDPTGANANLDVQWIFQDGTTGSGSITTHRFEEPGVYEVTAAVVDADGDIKTMTVPVEIKADSLFLTVSSDTTVVASMANFATPTIGALNGGDAGLFEAARPVFNEVLIFNTTTIRNPTTNRYDPIIELYNPTDTTIQIANWKLTDDLYYKNKFAFQAGSFMNPGEIITVWLDKRGGSTGYSHANFNPIETYAGEPEDYEGELYLFDAAGVFVDRIKVRNSARDVSFGHYPDASRQGIAQFSVTPELCGFDPTLGQFERFNFLWTLDDALGSVFTTRQPRHTFTAADAGVRRAVLQVFDTHTSVTRSDTILITVESQFD
jgi:PKD repeat protein